MGPISKSINNTCMTDVCTYAGFAMFMEFITGRQMNPKCYHAEFFGHKLHVDQSGKLVIFGSTHVCAIDGYSSKIVGLITLLVKNNYRIYADMFQ